MITPSRAQSIVPAVVGETNLLRVVHHDQPADAQAHSRKHDADQARDSAYVKRLNFVLIKAEKVKRRKLLNADEYRAE